MKNDTISTSGRGPDTRPSAPAEPPQLWRQEGILISDLGKYAMPRENLCRGLDRHKWDVVPYECTRCSGSMLYSRRGTMPAPVTVDPGLDGWYRIYAATLAPVTHAARLWLRIDGSPGPLMFTHGNTSVRWSSTEMCEEIFLDCADLTGRKITIGKAGGDPAPIIGLLWLRFEPMTEKETADYRRYFRNPATKRLHAHSDMDWIRRYGTDASMDEYCSVIDAYGSSDVGIATVEVYTMLSDKTQARALAENDRDLLDIRWPSQIALDGKREAVYREFVRRAEGYGMKLLAGHRMSLANFLIPGDDICCSNIPFVTDNPQWYCRDRDGETVPVLSYAYPEVGDFMIRQFLKLAEWGFHGVTLLLHRGVHILFEEPVAARFSQLHPGVAPCTLSLDDPRLAAVRCEFFTDFLRRLRKAFDEFSARNGRPRLAVMAYVGFGAADNRRLGLDIETWAKEKLIDFVSVAAMRVFEDEDSFRNDEDPCLLSPEKYRRVKRISDYSPVRRDFGNMPEEEIRCMADYRRISAETGVKFFYDIQWEGSVPPEEIGKYALKLYDAGAEGLSVWDCFEFRVSHRPEWFVTSRLGHRKDIAKLPASNDGYRRLYRMLSLDGASYAGYHPNWRG